MNEVLNKAIEAIEKQQPKERTAVWMVGEQLKDILRNEPGLAEMVLQDLENESQSIKACEKKIREYADKHKTGNFACVIPAEAERIIREFYGLHAEAAAVPKPAGEVIDLSAFF